MIRFTKEEKIVLIFLLACLFVGMSALYFRKTKRLVIPREAGIHSIDSRFPRNDMIKKININTASAQNLIKLKHVGPVLAERIISYRREYGPFKEKKDLKNVKGIGGKTYEKVEKQIVLE